MENQNKDGKIQNLDTPELPGAPSHFPSKDSVSIPIKVSFRIALLYLIFGSLWILLSDLVAEFLLKDPSLLTMVSMIKGWVFVSVTACLIAVLVHGSLVRIMEYDRHFMDSCESLRTANRELMKYRKSLDGLVRERTFKLEAATANAHSASRAKSDFLAHMSHEIRTPLNAIVGLTHLMGQTELSPKQSKYCAMMRNSSMQLLGIINDILDFSKIEAGKLELCEKPYSVRALITRVESILFPLIEGKGLKLEIHIDDDFPDRLVGDELRLGQILLNLSMNAVKFTKSGFIRIAVSREDAQEGMKLRFRVIDSGIGISEAQTKKLFKAFAQADSSTTKEYGGTGLGLAISKALVEAMGGTIELKSKVGVGTEFSFDILQFPEAEAEVAHVAKLPDAVRSAAEQPAAESSVTTSGARDDQIRDRTVLIVDDNEINLMILEECLRDSGLVITSASGGLETIEKTLNERFDIVLLDLHMPDVDGIAVARSIRARKDSFQPVIIALTADADSAVRDCVLGAGMNDFITKPIDHDNLLVCLAYWLERVPETGALPPGEA